MQFWEILQGSFNLIVSFDLELYQIVLLSLKISGLATIIATILGIITGYLLVNYESKLTKFFIILLSSLMGIPPVVVGLIVYFVFSSQGPLGVFSILFTPTAMIIAQVIVVYPIITSLMRQLLDDFWHRFDDLIKSYNMSVIAILNIFVKHSSVFILTIILTGFGRAISEVGAVMIVGGNIDHYTRVMTTAISLETSMGNLEKAMSLGIILIGVTMLANGIVFKFSKGMRYK